VRYPQGRGPPRSVHFKGQIGAGSLITSQRHAIEGGFYLLLLGDQLGIAGGPTLASTRRRQ